MPQGGAGECFFNEIFMNLQYYDSKSINHFMGWTLKRNFWGSFVVHLVHLISKPGAIYNLI